MSKLFMITCNNRVHRVPLNTLVNVIIPCNRVPLNTLVNDVPYEIPYEIAMATGTMVYPELDDIYQFPMNSDSNPITLW